MITNECIITFPVLFEPKPNLSGDLKFGCSILVPKSDKEGVAKLKAEIAKAASKGKSKLWAGRVPKFRYEALRDGDAELKDGSKTGKEYAGHFFVNCSAKETDPPGVVDEEAQPLMNKQKIYSGCIVRLDIKAFPYKTGGNNGIGWYLSNVMFVKDGDRLDGRLDAVDAFKNYASPEGLVDEQADEDSGLM